MIKILVASKNPVKIRAVELAFLAMFPKEDVAMDGIPAPSGISDQPKTDHETISGAKNRADHIKKYHPSYDFWVGIEGGVSRTNDEMMAFAWIYILSEHQSGKAKTAIFYLPSKVVKLIQQGMELGDADDIVFGKSNSKQKSGAVGLLTGNIVDRTSLYEQAVILALIPFKNPDLY